MPKKRATTPQPPEIPPKLLIQRLEAERRINEQIQKGQDLLQTQIRSEADVDQARNRYNTWTEYNTEMLKVIFDSPVIHEEYNYFGVGVGFWNPTFQQRLSSYLEDVTEKIRRLESIRERLPLFEISQNARRFDEESEIDLTTDAVQKIDLIASRFHAIVRQLRHRRDNRSTLDVSDEYDVQDLFHSILHLYFDDIRPEEWTPSYAGASSRMDFLLKREKVVVETKKTRQGLDARKLGEELTIDIAKYRQHLDCSVLYCFVYDPDGRIVNPRGIESDLSGQHQGLRVIVSIVPKMH